MHALLLTQADHVGSSTAVVHSQHLPGAAQAGLHLVGDPQHVVLVAQGAHSSQVALRSEAQLDRINSLKQVMGTLSKFNTCVLQYY